MTTLEELDVAIACLRDISSNPIDSITVPKKLFLRLYNEHMDLRDVPGILQYKNVKIMFESELDTCMGCGHK